MPLGANKAAIMGVAGVSTGDVVLLSSQTASDSASITFSSGITSTYGEYIFKFYNINPATDAAELTFQVNATDDAGGGYDTSTIQSTFFRWGHTEADGVSTGYHGVYDQANGTAFQTFAYDIGNGADESAAGEMHLFNPASTTYVKHFYARTNTYFEDSAAWDVFAAGYINDTTAIDDIQFKMSSGNFDGTIKMWGVK